MATPEQLAAILGNAKKLCNERADKVMDSMKSNQSNQGFFDDPDPASFSDIDDSMYLSEAREEASQSDFRYNERSLDNSRLPDAIRESFKNNQIDVSAMNPERSVLDSLNIPMPAKKVSQPKQRVSLSEQLNQPAVQPSSVGIDYNYLKYIISECIAEYFQKQPLNESNNLKTIGLKEGKINLVDNKGNIYSAELTYKGNTKDKKK